MGGQRRGKSDAQRVRARGGRVLREVAAANHEKLLLVIGGEDRSVGQFILNMAEDVVGIEQQGRVNSLNASVAAGIAMFALGQPR